MNWFRGGLTALLLTALVTQAEALRPSADLILVEDPLFSDAILAEAELDLMSDFGFTITRGQIFASMVSGEEGIEVAVGVFPTDLWFLAREVGSPEAALKLVAVEFDTEDGLWEVTRGPHIMTDDLSIPDGFTRISMNEALIPEPIISENASGEPLAPTSDNPVVFQRQSLETLFVTNPETEEVFAVRFDGLTPVSVSPTISYAYDFLDEALGEPDTLLARGPADVGSQIVQEFPESLFVLEQPDIFSVVVTPEETFVSVSSGISPERSAFTFFYSIDALRDRPYDDSQRAMLLDRQNQPLPGPNDGEPHVGTPALFRNYFFNFFATADLSSLNELLPTSMTIGQFPRVPGLPAGATLDQDGATGSAFFVARVGGMIDLVVSAEVVQNTGIPGPARNADGLRVDAEGNILGDSDPSYFNIQPLFTNFELNPSYPQRIHEIEMDSDGTMWVRAEVVRDEAGTQLFADIYHVDVAQTAAGSALPLPSRAPFMGMTNRGDFNQDSEVDVADYAALLNFLRDGGDVNDDPALLARADVDNNGFFDVLDGEAILTHPLTFPPSDVPADLFTGPGGIIDGIPDVSFDGGTFILGVGSADISDMELVDLNRDGNLDLTALIQDSFGDALLVQLGDGTDFPAASTGATLIGLPFPARDMIWLDLNLDGSPDVAMVDEVSDGSGTLKTFENIGVSVENIGGFPFGFLFLEETGTFDAGVSPIELAAGLYDNDSREDILIGNDTDTDNLTIYLNNFPGGLALLRRTVNDAPAGIALGDLQSPADPENIDPFTNPPLPLPFGGGPEDLVIGANSDFTVRAFIQSTGGAQIAQDREDTASSPVDVVIGRFVTPEVEAATGRPLDADYADVAAFGSPGVTGGDIIFFRHEGNGRLARISDISVGGFINATDGAVADFNCDGRDDVAVIGFDNFRDAGGLAIYASNPLMIPFNFALSTGLADQRFLVLGASHADCEVGDIDNDGDPDVFIAVVGSANSNGFAVLENLVLNPPPSAPPVAPSLTGMEPDAEPILRRPEPRRE